jgi:hypothetical protein
VVVNSLGIETIPKKGAAKLSKNLRGITATSLQKLTPDVIGYTAIYFNLYKTP